MPLLSQAFLGKFPRDSIEATSGAAAARPVVAPGRDGRLPATTNEGAKRVFQNDNCVGISRGLVLELQVTTLPSGMRVASQYTPDDSPASFCMLFGDLLGATWLSSCQETVTVGVWIDAGSRFETKDGKRTHDVEEH